MKKLILKPPLGGFFCEKVRKIKIKQKKYLKKNKCDTDVTGILYPNSTKIYVRLKLSLARWVRRYGFRRK